MQQSITRHVYSMERRVQRHYSSTIQTSDWSIAGFVRDRATSCALGDVGDHRGDRKMMVLKLEDLDGLRRWNDIFRIVEKRESEALEFLRSLNRTVWLYWCTKWILLKYGGSLIEKVETNLSFDLLAVSQFRIPKVIAGRIKRSQRIVLLSREIVERRRKWS